MKRFWRILIAALLVSIVLPACAEFDDMDDMEYWSDQLYWITEEIGARPIGSEGEVAAMDYLRAEFESFGFSAENGTLQEYPVEIALGNDLEAILPAAQSEEPHVIIICAHYDSTMYGPGTRDNGSGMAAMLAMAREFSAMEPYPDTELRFVAFTAEETGHQGSQAYVAQLEEEERQRIIAAFNLDLITTDVWLMDHVFSVDTMGMRTADGYVDGSDEAPAMNKVARAVTAAIEELEYFDPEENGYSYCVPRHLGMSDHDSFHYAGIDSANLAFRGNEEEGGTWHPYMHGGGDTHGDLDLERTYQALNIVFTAVSHLAEDPAYGD